MALAKIFFVLCSFSISSVTNQLYYGDVFHNSYSYYASNRPSLDTSSCSVIKSFYDVEGDFLKYICEIREEYFYDLAESFCYEKGMDLLIIENRSVLQNLVTYFDEHYPNFEENSAFWLNGRKFGNSWFAYKNNKKSEFPSILRFNPSESGKCYMLKGKVEQKNVFEGSSGDCNKKHYFLCEYASTV
jgi:hypothetical protein